MSDYSVTKARIYQWVGILFLLAVFAGAYWYFQVRAGVKQNTASSQPQGVGRLDSGLAGYWAMDNGSGTSATDSSTNGNTGTLTNGPTWTTGQIGSAVSLDGTDDYISTGTTLVSMDSITLSAWVKGDTPTTDYPIFGNINGQEGSDHQCLFYDNGGTENLYFGNGVGGTVSFQVSGTGATLGTNWHHVVYTNNGTKNSLYLDGIRLVETTSNALTSASEANLQIGRCQTGGGTFYFDGLIDEARVYRRALSLDEIGQLYHLTAPTSVDTSLKGYWSFDGQDISGVTAYDRSGAGNTGTLTSGPAITQGVAGQALSFDGTDDYISIGNVTALKNSVFTYSAWVKPNTLVNERNIFGGNAGNTPRFSVTSNGALVLTDTSVTIMGTSTGKVPANTWSHVAVTYDVSGNYIFYINGVDVGSGTNLQTFNFTSASFVISNDSSNYFSGSIDEVRVYNRVLAVGEIKSLYDIAKPDATNSVSSQAQGSGRLDSGLTGYWALDDGSGTSATDVSTNGNTGTLAGNATWTTGQVGGAVTFDGVNDYISIGNNASTNVMGKITVSAWVYSGTSATDQDVISKYNGASAVQYLFLLNSAGTTLRFFSGDGNSNNAAAGTIPLATWTHVTGIYDGINTKLYINGVFVANAVTPLTPTASGTGLYLGTRSDSSRDFNGKLDEVRIYNRDLSADEVSQLHRLTSPTSVDTSLKGYWSFNGKDLSGTTAYDRSGLGSNGTLTNSPTIINGIIGQGLSFDGTDDHVNLGASTPYQFANTTFTVTGWFKSSPSVNGGAFVAQGGIAGQGGWFVGLNGDTGGKLTAVLKNTDGGQTGRLSDKTGFNDNNWHQFAFVVTTDTSTYTGNSLVIYADGVLQPSTANSDSTSGGYDTDGSAALLGSRGSASDAFFNGGLDEVRIYNRVLTVAEIQSQYDTVKPDKINSSATQAQGVGRLDSGLAGYWKLDETTGSMATDSSTGGNNGTLSNMENGDWVAGQIGNGLSFDGTNESVTVSAGTGVLDASQNVTLSTWVYPRSLGAYQGYIYKGVSGCSEASASYMLENNSYPVFWMGGSSLAAGDSTLVANQWQHLVATNSAGGSALYLNGVLIKSGTALPAPSTSSEDWNFNYCNRSDANLDEIRIYNRALSGDEVSQLYRLTSPTSTDTSLKGYWSFNGKDLSGTTVYDRSGSGYTGTLAGSPAVINGKLGQGLSFDGVDDFVNLLTVPSALFTNSTSTMTGWFKTSSSAGQGILSQDHCSGGWFIRIESGTLSVSLRAGGSCGGGSASRSSSVTNLANGAWHHFAVVMTTDTVTAGNNNVVIYIDGVLNQGSLTSGLVYGTAADNRVQIGTRYSGDQLFSGSIDEVRIYNRALTATEVLGLYNASR